MDLSHLPLSLANYLSIMGFVCLLVLVWLVPRNIVYEDAPDQSRWRDIRFWATILIAFQVLLYGLFTR